MHKHQAAIVIDQKGSVSALSSSPLSLKRADQYIVFADLQKQLTSMRISLNLETDLPEEFNHRNGYTHQIAIDTSWSYDLSDHSKLAQFFDEYQRLPTSTEIDTLIHPRSHFINARLLQSRGAGISRSALYFCKRAPQKFPATKDLKQSGIYEMTSILISTIEIHKISAQKDFQRIQQYEGRLLVENFSSTTWLINLSHP